LVEDLRSAATSRLDYEPHDVTDDEAALQADAVEGRLVAMDEALARIDAGGYGNCVVCGVEIATERLAALPAAAVCRRCAN
jgi:RNA polymerase-binding transcription factor DksA